MMEEPPPPAMEEQASSLHSRIEEVTESGLQQLESVRRERRPSFEDGIGLALACVRKEQMRIQKLCEELRAEQQLMREENRKAYLEQQKVLSEVSLKLSNLQSGKETIGAGVPADAKDTLPLPRECVESSGSIQTPYWYELLPKFDLPMFDGEEPWEWLSKCRRYLRIYAVPEIKRVELASLFLTGKAETWFQNWMRGKGMVEWMEFEEAVLERFGDRLFRDVVESFNSLTQEGSVEEYHLRFEDLRLQMERLYPQLPQSHYIASFVAGLKGEIKPMVRLLKPTTLYQAAEKARIQEALLQQIARARIHQHSGMMYRSSIA